MSYDLGLVRSNESPEDVRSEVLAYLGNLGLIATVTSDGLTYYNKTTGVRLFFGFESDPEEPLTLAVNVRRPSIFAREAAEVVTALTERFLLETCDIANATRGRFDATSFCREWDRLNAFACGLDAGSGPFPMLPRDELTRHWFWNRYIDRYERVIGGIFATKVVYRWDGRSARSMAVVGDIPTVVPLVDDVCLVRKVETGLFKKTSSVLSSLRPFSAIVPLARAGVESLEDHPCVTVVDPGTLFAKAFAKPLLPPDAHGTIAVETILDRETLEAARSPKF